MKITVFDIDTSSKRPFPWSRVILIAVSLGCSPLAPRAQAVSPAPDGGYPGGNTAEGQAALFSLTTGAYNTGVGLFSLKSNATGDFNTATGAGALLATTADENTATGAAALFSNTTGEANAAHGAFALFNNTDGSDNTASGLEALFTNKTGRDNTAAGVRALFLNDGDPSNNQGSENSAFGTSALLGNTTGYANSAFGAGALDTNNSGSFNTACGFIALGGAFQGGDGTIATGDKNTATGAYALASNTSGFFNTATGVDALSSNNEGDSNTADGIRALFSNTSGFFNTAIGFNALASNIEGAANTAIGITALVNNSTGNDNIGLGDGAGFSVTTASNVICIGRVGGGNISDSCFIDNIYSNIQPVIGINPDYVTVDANGRLGRSNLNGSSRRFKHDIQPMDKASEVLFALKPVSFRYNKEYDATQRPFFGLIAEDVAEAAPDLVGRNKQGEPDSVRYEQINAMLLNECLKEHKKVEGQQETIIELKSTVAQQRKDFETIVTRQQNIFQSKFSEQERQIEALASDLQKVSAQLEVSKPTPQTVVNNP
jgi:trimeric autotransporter adhesin